MDGKKGRKSSWCASMYWEAVRRVKKGLVAYKSKRYVRVVRQPAEAWDNETNQRSPAPKGEERAKPSQANMDKSFGKRELGTQRKAEEKSRSAKLPDVSLTHLMRRNQPNLTQLIGDRIEHTMSIRLDLILISLKPQHRNTVMAYLVESHNSPRIGLDQARRKHC